MRVRERSPEAGKGGRSSLSEAARNTLGQKAVPPLVAFLRLQLTTLFPFFPPFICHEVMGLDAMICFLNVEFPASLFTLLFHFHQEAV